MIIPKGSCRECAFRMVDYCIEHEMYVELDDSCSDHMNSDYANMMCDLMCPPVEE